MQHSFICNYNNSKKLVTYMFLKVVKLIDVDVMVKTLWHTWQLLEKTPDYSIYLSIKLFSCEISDWLKHFTGLNLVADRH